MLEEVPSFWLSEGISGSVVLTLCNPMDYSPPASSFHGIFRARILSGLPFPFPRDFLDLGIEPGSPALWAGSLASEPLGKPSFWDKATLNNSLCHLTKDLWIQNYVLLLLFFRFQWFKNADYYKFGLRHEWLIFLKLFWVIKKKNPGRRLCHLLLWENENVPCILQVWRGSQCVYIYLF